MKKTLQKAHIYIHFPFCLYKCHYCDFNSYAFKQEDIPFGSYRQALIDEVDQRRKMFAETGKHFFDPRTLLSTIYIGGGTPSLCSPEDIRVLLGVLKSHFKSDESLEVTLEANPRTIDEQKLKGFRKAGVTRLSLGVQSFHEAYLKNFGRIHSAEDAREAISLVSLAGFDSWNIDLIFGFPGQSVQEWEKDLQEVLENNPPHISCYSFTVEEEAPYGKMVQKGLAPLPSEDLQASMFKKAGEMLGEAGYHHYEISNYAREGFESRHNRHYWNYGQFVGLGAGAVSFLRSPVAGLSAEALAKEDRQSPVKRSDKEESSSQEDPFGYRTTNIKIPDQYMKAIMNQDAKTSDERRATSDPPNYWRTSESRNWFELEEISHSTAMGEFMMMGLRLSYGVSLRNFQRLFERRVDDCFKSQIAQFRRLGWMDREGVCITEKGRLFSNQVVREFLP